MTWDEMARQNLVAAKLFSQKALWRSSVSRAYYAAYAGVAGALEGLASYPAGRLGPSHDLLPQLVMTYLTALKLYERRNIAAAARRLYRLRIAADYQPPERVEASHAVVALQDARSILKMVANAKI